MNDPADMTERHGRMLAELSELGLALARDLQARALAAEESAEAAEMALAYHRVARSVRQTLALEARLERDRVRAARERRAEAGRQVEIKVRARKAEVRAVVTRAIWSEAEGDEAEALLDELDERLDEDAACGGFLDGPVEACIARIRQDLGLSDPPSSPAPSIPSGSGERSSRGREAVKGALAAQPPARSAIGTQGLAHGADHPWRSSA